MKKLFLSILILQFGLILRAQDKQQYLEVDYQMELKFDIEEIVNNVPAEWRSVVEEQLRQEAAGGVFVDYKLKTNNHISEYKLQEKLGNSQSGGMAVAQIVAADKEPLFKNFDEGNYLKSYNFGKAYIVKDSLRDMKWKITKESQKIAGFDTYKATGVMSDSIAVTAWYTPKLNFKDGPDRLWGLPGLILKAEFKYNGTDMIITAQNVAVKDEELKIKLPEKGKTLTEKEFSDEMKKLQEQYQQMYSGGVDTE